MNTVKGMRSWYLRCICYWPRHHASSDLISFTPLGALLILTLSFTVLKERHLCLSFVSFIATSLILT